MCVSALNLVSFLAEEQIISVSSFTWDLGRLGELDSDSERSHSFFDEDFDVDSISANFTRPAKFVTVL